MKKNTGRGFAFRLLTVGDIKATISAATKARRIAMEQRDAAALTAAIAAQRHAQRQAGRLLELGVATAVDFAFWRQTELRYRKFAKMTDAEFAAALSDHQTGAVDYLLKGSWTARTRMVVGPWYLAGDGCMTREITAADVADDDTDDAQQAA